MSRNVAVRRHALGVMAVVLILVLSACDTFEPAPTPVLDASAIETAAAETIAVGQATEVPFVLATPTSGGLPTIGATSVIPNTGATASAGGITAQGCDNLTYISDVTVPDGTVTIPGEQFVKTWAVENTGSCPWTTDYELAFINGDSMNGATASLAAAVTPGTTANISVSLTAPTAPGNYTGSWRMKNAAGVYFGDVLTVVITVATGGKGSTGGPIARVSVSPASSP